MSPEAQALRDEVLSNDLLFAYKMALNYLRDKTVFDAEEWDAAFWERLAEVKHLKAEL